MTKNLLIQDLGNGLILRHGAPADAEAVAEFCARIHSDDGPEKPDLRVGTWASDLLAKPHPTFQPGDYTLVEETATGRLVSMLNLIPQTWSYAGIPFEVGRPELVGTLPEFRGRGLVRLQFETIHRWGVERGHQVQAITGIPYYYRQFGYEMTLRLGGGWLVPRAMVPPAPTEGGEPFKFRPAQAADLPFIAGLYDASCKRLMISCRWDETLWRYELEGKSPNNINRCEIVVIENPSGEPVGFLTTPFEPWSGSGRTMLPVYWLEAVPQVSYGALAPAVLRYLRDAGDAMLRRLERPDGVTSVGLWLGGEHPVYEALSNQSKIVRPAYAWYIRVADLPGFISHIAPALEQRLAGSAFHGHSGELKLSFYRRGLRLVFEQGRLATVENWAPFPQGHSGDAGFPDLTFLHLVFGHRSLQELRGFYPDCWVDKDEAAGLLEALFPKQHSDLWPVS